MARIETIRDESGYTAKRLIELFRGAGTRRSRRQILSNTPACRPSILLSMIQVHEVFAYLRVRGAAQAIEFYKAAFDAEEVLRLSEPGGRIGHAEIKIGSTVLMLADEHAEYGIVGPQSLGGTSVAIHLHVDDVDALMEKAKAAGATVVRELQNQFYGERSGSIRDPFGHEWLLGQSIETVSPEEMQRRYDALMASGPGQE